MTDIATFILARLDEDEAVAREVVDTIGDAIDYAEPSGVNMPLDDIAQAVVDAVPYLGRALADVESKRRTVGLHKAEDSRGGWGATPDYRCSECGGRSAHPNLGWVPFARRWPCDTLRLLALPYRDHADYQREWEI